jgi:hypothetical protein
MSSIILNSTHSIDKINNSTFKIDFERSVSLFDKHIALTSASLHFSWRNITSSNNKFSYIWIDGVEYSVELPIGFYEISDAISPSVSIGSLIIDRTSEAICSKLKNGSYNHLTFRILSSKTFRPIEIMDSEINFIFTIK